jgi:hypothetical protein
MQNTSAASAPTVDFKALDRAKRREQIAASRKN